MAIYSTAPAPRTVQISIQHIGPIVASYHGSLAPHVHRLAQWTGVPVRITTTVGPSGRTHFYLAIDPPTGGGCMDVIEWVESIRLECPDNIHTVVRAIADMYAALD